MKQALQQKLAEIVAAEFGLNLVPELTRPDEKFGDYATNIALQLAPKLNKNPQGIAEHIRTQLLSFQDQVLEKVEVAGAGFLNFWLSDRALMDSLADEPEKSLAGQVIVAEYSDPNPFKVLHAGHLYTSIVGDAIANLLERAGAQVQRVNYGGDVGLHVGKSLWAMERDLKGDLPQKWSDRPIEQRAEWMAKCYVAGAEAYETDEDARRAIINFNKQVYEIHEKRDYTSYLAQIYWLCREWSYQYFTAFYQRIGCRFDKFYPESEVADLGLTAVKAHTGTVYQTSDGAVVFAGEKFGLHTRVFITSQGLPTYEAKDVGLIIKKYETYHFDQSLIITSNDQAQYMAVVQKSVEQFAPEMVRGNRHLTHGLVKLAGAEKMSSRKGNILRAADVLDVAADAAHAAHDNADEQTVLGAVKYAFLKQRLGGDIIYNPQESVSIEGNSGPYLQYAHARARSILSKFAKSQSVSGQPPSKESFDDIILQGGERSLVRKISQYPEVVELATSELMPHHIGTYLYELSQEFNRFYEHNQVLGDERQALRLHLVGAYAGVLKDGLALLGIAAPDKI
ncbi:MAG: arginine--tRNA ligase [Candidatus Saccharimonadales bacterium]